MDMVPQLERKLVEDPLDATIGGEHMDSVGHLDENEGHNEKEDPSDAAIDGEHMDAIGHPDENEGPNEKTEEPNADEPISYVLNTPVDNSDVLMMDSPDTINLADPPSHEFEITSPCDSKKKGDRLDGAKANQVYIPLNIKNDHWFLTEFQIRTGVVIFYDTLSGMSKHGIFKKKDIDPERYNITFEFSNHAPKQAGLYRDCGVWVCIMMYRLANGLSMDFPPGPIQTALAYMEK
nr:phospholipase-like protein [Tanacetum cinerariifolium]